MTVCDICKASKETKHFLIGISAGLQVVSEGSVDLCGDCAGMATADTFKAGLVSVRRKGNRKPKAEPAVVAPACTETEGDIDDF